MSTDFTSPALESLTYACDVTWDDACKADLLCSPVVTIEQQLVHLLFDGDDWKVTIDDWNNGAFVVCVMLLYYAALKC